MMNTAAKFLRTVHAGWLVMPALALLVSCATNPPEIRPVSSPYQLGSIQVDPANQEIIVTGYINQVEGMIELMACGPGGKTHEAVFVLQAKPVDIHAGLLLLGLHHGEPMKQVGEGPPRGDPVRMEIEWVKNGQPQRDPPEKFIYDVKTKKALKRVQWIFNGSMMKDGHYMANMEESMIATYWDPWAIINIGHECGGDDERLAINRKTIPPLLTPVRLIIKPAGKRT